MNLSIYNGLRAVKRRAKCLLGLDIALRPEVALATEFHGTEYGGWAIIPQSIQSTSVVYSFGIGEDASFDLSLINKYGCEVHGFDPTPKSREWVDREIRNSRFVMHPWALNAQDGVLRLFLPKNREHVSASLAHSALMSDEYFDAPAMRLSTIMRKLGHPQVDVLKMDIEGAEYGVIADLCSTGAIGRVGQLLVEFHHWMPGISPSASRKALAQLRSVGLRMSWVSQGGHEVLFSRTHSDSKNDNGV